ncbi:MAG TPA: Uma2 family endonuclease [Saprospiraceae bacterium]|nr:Uma2 family endonuclease [Saprospiraceae bacterium]HMQ83609.1 Uma2 family endonuclease [Saprospiraceae bacterium]
MTASVAKKRFNTSEYRKMAEMGILPERGIELIEGEIIEMSPIGGKHLSCVNTLAELLSEQLGKSVILSIQNPVQLDVLSEPEPDIAILKRISSRYADHLPTAKDTLLLIEVADTSYAYEKEIKLPLYAKSLIPEYWIVRLETAEIEVFWHPSGENYLQHQLFRRGEIAQSQHTSLALPVNEVFFL